MNILELLEKAIPAFKLVDESDFTSKFIFALEISAEDGEALYSKLVDSGVHADIIKDGVRILYYDFEIAGMAFRIFTKKI